MQELQDSFEEIVTGGADKAETFLQVVRERALQENVGLVFTATEIPKTRQVVLQAPIQLGGTFFRGAPMKLTVHANPVGSSLQVGWQLTEQAAPSALMMFEKVQAKQASLQARNLRPENQRKLNGMLLAFHKTVFLPVLGMLIDALKQSQGSQGSGGLPRA